MNASNSVGQIRRRRILRKLVPAAILTPLVALAVFVAAAWNNILSDGGHTFRCDLGWRATKNCDAFGQLDPAGHRDCHANIPTGESGWCHCSQGLAVRRHGCETRPVINCRRACEELNRSSVMAQRREADSSEHIQQLRAGAQPEGWRWRSGDLQALTNTARCQLLRGIQSSPGMEAVPHRVSVEAAVEAALQEDFHPWAGGFSRADVWKLTEEIASTNVQMVWEVKNGTFGWADRTMHPNCSQAAGIHWAQDEPCMILDAAGGFTGAVHGVDRLFWLLYVELQAGVAEGLLKPPDCLFLLSVFDAPAMCPGGAGDTPSCVAPPLTLIRHDGYQEVPVPVMWGVQHDRYDWPWEQKQEVAFWRGTPYCWPMPLGGHEHIACSRAYLDELSKQHPDLINVTVKGSHGANFDEVPEEEHTRWKYLAHLDGYSASYRLSMLLHANSVVLKQDSAWSEYWYRFARPCFEFIPFWTRSPDDLLDEVLSLRHADGFAKQVAATGQAFALRHLNRLARFRYWQALLDRYATLQRDARLPPPDGGTLG